MKTTALYILLLLISFPVLAQKEDKPSFNKEKLESAKVAFITQRLDLSPVQAEKFWPLYHQHNKQKWNLMKSIKELLDFEEEISEARARELIDQKFKMEQQLLDLEKAFIKDIMKIISPVQAIKLGDVNRDFARHIYRMQKRDKNPSE